MKHAGRDALERLEPLLAELRPPTKEPIEATSGSFSTIAAAACCLTTIAS